MKPPPTLERLWLAYVFSVAVVCAFSPDVPAPAKASHLALHAGIAAVAIGIRRFTQSPGAERLSRAVLAIVGLPVVFSAMAWLLPAVHPEPYEYVWLELDRALFGADLGVVIAGWLSPWLVELLQCVYACFYAIPIIAGVAALRRSGTAAFDRSMVLVVGGFLASYVGYLLVPTLAPKVVLGYATDVEGLWATDMLRRAIDAGEVNPWDCFPSGHTMLTIISLIIAWRWNRRWFWLLLVPASLLIASTMLLRYHWAIDVVVGAGIAWPWVRFCDWLADRDGWPRPAPRPA